jgi:hypothetical protein
MATTNLATTTDPYGDNSFQTLWTTLAQLNNAQNLKPLFSSNVIKLYFTKYFKLKTLRITSLEIYPSTLMTASKL